MATAPTVVTTPTLTVTQGDTYPIGIVLGTAVPEGASAKVRLRVGTALVDCPITVSDATTGTGTFNLPTTLAVGNYAATTFISLEDNSFKKSGGQFKVAVVKGI